MFVLGHRGPRALLSAGATVCVAPGLSHAHFVSPRSLFFFFSLSLSLSLSLYLSLSLLAKTLVHKVLREYPADWRLSA